MPFGIPVSKAYKEDITKEEAKEKLGLDKNKKYVLMQTGSMGFGNIINVLRKLVDNINDIIFVVACGNNKKMLEEIKLEFEEGKNVIAIPYCKNLSLYIKASEIVLTKPGGLTTTEIAVSRKPFIHTMPIPGCENYNAEYFNKRKMSIKSNSLDDIINNTKHLLEDIELQEQMMQNQMKNISGDTCDKIAEIILKN